jgi:carbamate kinase
VRIVVALGGNALLERGERPDAGVQRRHVRAAARVFAPLAARHELVLCHGNGPQIGVLAEESGTDPALAHPFPLDVLGARTQGMIGYWLVRELAAAGLSGPVAALLTQTVVDRDDPAFRAPTKFVGRTYPRAGAERLASAHGWTIAADTGGWRRVVPSPAPRRIVEMATVEACARFVTATGRTASIGALRDAAAVLAGEAGTTVTPAGTGDPR